MTGRRIPWTPLVASAVALVGAAALYVSGGLAVAEKRVPEVRPGETIDQGWFGTTFTEAVARPRKRQLDVVVKVINKGEETAGLNEDFVGSIIQVTPPLTQEKDARPEAFTTDPTAVTSGLTNNQLHPGVEESAVVRYQLPAQIPAEIVVDVGGFEWREDFFGVGERWAALSEEPTIEERIGQKPARPAVVARVALPVRQASE